MASESQRPNTLGPLSDDIVLDNIIPLLDPASFLAFCRTCKYFYHPSFRHDLRFWRDSTQSTFRIAKHPLDSDDGAHWQKLYKLLMHNTRVYTWGQNSRGALGQEDPSIDLPAPSPPPRGMLRGRGPILRRGRVNRELTHRAFPFEMFNSKDLGIIADLQCGGWSTTLLTSKGVLYTVGTLDGGSFGTGDARVLSPLRYPPGFPHPIDHYEQATAIKQFSSGRSHILGLSDSGKIWSWHSINEPSWNIVFTEREISEKSHSYADSSYIFREKAISRSNGTVRKVVAGWSNSSAYINGTGIVLWATANRKHYGSDLGKDTLIIQHSVLVPRSNYIRPLRNAREPDQTTDELGSSVGEVINHIVLEHFVVFVTDLGKFFAARMEWSTTDTTGHIERTIELTALRADPETVSKRDKKFDIQGSFRTFAAFRNNGEVIIGTQDYLERCWNSDPSVRVLDTAGLKKIPALQNSGVVSVAFGDYHYHALHSNGKITSYGKEPQQCGALGLGGHGEAESRLRGMQETMNDRQLVQHGYTTGRKIWFNDVNRQWIRFLSSGGADPAEAQERIRLTTTDMTALGEVSEWIEQQGSDWDKKPEIAAADEDGLGTHYAFGIAAAGWHSGALVLVNETLSKKLEESCIVRDGAMQQPRRVDPSAFNEPWNHGAALKEGVWYKWAQDRFPRLKLSDGRDMPGGDDVPFDEWKYPRPDFVLGHNF